MDLREAAQQALEALRLSVPKPRSKDDDYIEQGWKEHSDAISVLCSALTKPEQEPIAWITPGQDLHLFNPEGFQDWVALYTAPPKRNPMTEQQLDEMFDQAEIAIYIADRQQKEHLEVYSFGVRDAEKWHGIGGEK